MKHKEKAKWATSTRVFYKLISSGTMRLSSEKDGKVQLVELLVQEEAVQLKSAQFNLGKIFPSLDGNPVEIIKRVAKLMKGLADDEILSFSGTQLVNYHPYNPEFAALNSCQVGSKLASDNSWKFNIKYVDAVLTTTLMLSHIPNTKNGIAIPTPKGTSCRKELLATSTNFRSTSKL